MRSAKHSHRRRPRLVQHTGSPLARESRTTRLIGPAATISTKALLGSARSGLGDELLVNAQHTGHVRLRLQERRDLAAAALDRVLAGVISREREAQVVP